jgi:hypothetical protein
VFLDPGVVTNNDNHARVHRSRSGIIYAIFKKTELTAKTKMAIIIWLKTKLAKKKTVKTANSKMANIIWLKTKLAKKIDRKDG